MSDTPSTHENTTWWRERIPSSFFVFTPEELAERDRQVRAEAWDEGYRLGDSDGSAKWCYTDGTQLPPRTNPYRDSLGTELA